MTEMIRQHAMDVAFFQFRQPTRTNGGSWRFILLLTLLAVLFLAAGYALGVRAGAVPIPRHACCENVIALDFNFDFERDNEP